MRISYGSQSLRYRTTHGFLPAALWFLLALVVLAVTVFLGQMLGMPAHVAPVAGIMPNHVKEQFTGIIPAGFDLSHVSQLRIFKPEVSPVVVVHTNADNDAPLSIDGIKKPTKKPVSVKNAAAPSSVPTKSPVQEPVLTPNAQPTAEKIVQQAPAATVVEQKTVVQTTISPLITTNPVMPTPAIAPPQVVPPQSVRNRRFGFSVADELSIKSDAELARILDDMKLLGVGWIRIDFDWGVIQARGPTSYNWAPTDRTVREANKRGIAVLPILLFTPSWARSDGCDSNRCAPRDPALFADFARSAVHRYAPQGIHTWEIWNEPNSRQFWKPQANVERYVELLKLTSGAIKEEDSTAVIVSGGLAPKATANGNIAPLDFVTGMYELGAGPSFDALGFHPYAFPITPTHFLRSSAWSQMSETQKSLRSIMMGRGDSAKKIWLTEFGAPTGGPGSAAGPDNFTSFQDSDHVNDSLQVQILDEAVRQTAIYDWAGPLFWYSYQDLGTNLDTNENFFGLLRKDGTKKPAYDALNKLLQSGILR